MAVEYGCPETSPSIRSVVNEHVSVVSDAIRGAAAPGNSTTSKPFTCFTGTHPCNFPFDALYLVFRAAYENAFRFMRRQQAFQEFSPASPPFESSGLRLNNRAPSVSEAMPQCYSTLPRRLSELPRFAFPYAGQPEATLNVVAKIVTFHSGTQSASYPHHFYYPFRDRVSAVLKLKRSRCLVTADNVATVHPLRFQGLLLDFLCLHIYGISVPGWNARFVLTCVLVSEMSFQHNQH
jgi:hypothetical protein